MQTMALKGVVNVLAAKSGLKVFKWNLNYVKGSELCTFFLSPFIHPHSCSFDAFLSIICFFLQPMKALRASARTSQPVLSSQQVQTVFYQVPEIRDIHQSFSSGLKARLSAHCLTESCPGGEEEVKHSGFKLMVGDLFLKMVSSPYLNWGCYFSVESFYRVSSSHKGKRFKRFRQQNTRVCITCCRIVRGIIQKYGLIMTKMSSWAVKVLQKKLQFI